MLVDIFYDHLLAQTWSMYHEQPLDAYSASVYGQIAARIGEIPETAHRAMSVMAAEGWFVSYARLDGIATVLDRMSRRARQPNPLAGGAEEFVADIEGFAQDFHTWLDDAQHFASQWRATA